MTNATKTISAGPDRTAISRRARQPMPRLRRRGGSAIAALPPPVGRSVRDAPATCALSRRDAIGYDSSGLLGGVVDGLDDALRAALAGQHVDDADVQRVADVLAVHGVQPLRHERSGVVGLQDALEVGLLDDRLRLGVHRRGVEGLVVLLLDRRRGDVVEEVSARLLRGLGRARVAVDTAQHRAGLALTALDLREGEEAQVG